MQRRRRTLALLVLTLSAALFSSASFAGGNNHGARRALNSLNEVSSPPPGKRLVLRLRSFAPRASGQLEVEPTKEGGRLRLTAANLPSPETLSPHARAFVVWASGGRILRLGELRRDGRGAATLVFTHPANLDHYSLIVTAEQSANVERPAGAPVFSTRANEVAAFYSGTTENARPSVVADTRPRTTTTATAANDARRESRPPVHAATPSAIGRSNANASTTATTTSAPHRNPANAPTTAASSTVLRTRSDAENTDAVAGEFYAEVDETVDKSNSARTLMLVGDRGARGARGRARVAMHPDGTAYVRVRFSRVPPPSRFGKGRRYAMWALNPEDGTVYIGSLPARNLNRRPTYARTTGVKSDKFRLLVTAERRTPPTRPAGRRVLMTFKGRRRK